jgi:hypothetical protein
MKGIYKCNFKDCTYNNLSTNYCDVCEQFYCAMHSYNFFGYWYCDNCIKEFDECKFQIEEQVILNF